jgi:hypothetical protein
VPTYRPPVAVAEAARRALELRASLPPSRRGMTPTGIRRATQLANRQPVSVETLRRMVSFFARHEVDKSGKGWGVDSKGYQAWLGWGGDPGRAWARRILRRQGS